MLEVENAVEVGEINYLFLNFPLTQVIGIHTVSKLR